MKQYAKKSLPKEIEHAQTRSIFSRASINNISYQKNTSKIRSKTVFNQDFSQIPIRTSSQVQPKLKIGQPEDKYEKEADWMADEVVKIPISDCSDCTARNDNPIQAKKITNSEYRSFHSSPTTVDEALQSSGQPLEPGVRKFMEQHFGHDFSQVKIHANIKSAESAQSLNALAYTVGHDIVFNKNQYNPNSTAGRHLLAHELSHVVQQNKSQMTGSPFVQRVQTGQTKQRSSQTCSMNAFREWLGTGFCIHGRTNAPDGTVVNFHNPAGMDRCSYAEMSIFPLIGFTRVRNGHFSWQANTNLITEIPGSGRLVGAIIGNAACCARVRGVLRLGSCPP